MYVDKRGSRIKKQEWVKVHGDGWKMEACRLSPFLFYRALNSQITLGSLQSLCTLYFYNTN
jgi:hypothetical protein